MDADKVGDLFRFLGGRSLVGRLAVLNGYITEAQIESADQLLTKEQKADLERQEAEILRGDRAEPSGRALGHYLLVEQLGGGQAGVVWKAWDTKLQRWVAVTEAREDFSRERFLREARASAKVRHPHLVQAIEVGRHEEHDYIVMNLVEGKPLDQAALPPARAAAVLADIADAVAALHAAGVLHRDIKPQNILLDEKGHGWLADFGIARDRAAQPLTLEGTLMGTPVYMAPEQALGKPERVGEAADVYGLGSTLYHVVTGRTPFVAEDDLRTVLRRLSDETPPAPRTLVPDLAPDLDAIIRRAMEKHPEDRYPGAAAMAEDLRRYLRGEPLTASTGRAARWVRRHPALLVSATVVLLLGILGAAHYVKRERYTAHYQQGVDRLTRGAATEALESFDAALAVAPERPETYLMRGRCLARLKRVDEAIAAWSTALMIDPTYGPALLERGKAIVATYVQRRLPPAARVSNGRIRFGALEPEQPADRDRRLRGEQDLEQARSAAHLERVDLRFIQGALAYGKGRYKQAAEALGEYAAKNPWDAEGLSLLAAASYLARDFAGAERALTRAIELQPRPDRYRARGDARYGLGLYAAAIEDYTRADDDVAARCGRGLALQALGKPAEAVEQYARALEMKPRDARSLNNRGTAKADLLDLDGAQQDFEAALEATEFYAEAYHNLGNVLLLKDRPADAIRQYDLALGCDADYIEAYVHRARARLKIGKLDDAAADLDQALNRDPANPELLFDVATTEQRRGNTARAIETMKKAQAAAHASSPLREQAQILLDAWSR